MIVGNNGRKVCVRFLCPKCRHPITKVMLTGGEPGGVIVRRRKCLECGHAFFTAQEPEYLINPARIRWELGRPIVVSD